MPADPTVVILVNIVAPYRVPVYRRIGSHFRTLVFYAGGERNRTSWTGVEDGIEGVVARRSAGLSIPFRVGGEQVYDEKYLHLPVGHLLDLFRTRPDAILTNEMGARTILALLYGSVTRTPVWVWWGGTLHTERGIGRVRKMVRAVIRRWAPRWISYGVTSTEYLESIGVRREAILQIQNCVDESLYGTSTTAAPAPPRSPAPSPRLLYVGQMIRRKGVDLFLEAAARVQGEGLDFSILLVGDGAERQAFESMATSLGLDNVQFLAGQRPEALPAIYRSADCLVFPTCEDVWGLVVNEAMWSGLPVIASTHAGCATELLPPEQIFDPFDLDGFTQVLRSAIDGDFGPPDTSRLKPCAEVGDMIAADIERVIGGRRAG